jgi:MFS family permease
MPTTPPHDAADKRAALKFIVCLGVVSLFADMTYEGAYSGIGSLLRSMGATAFTVGLISGLGEMLAAGLRYFSGRVADRTRAYWTIVVLGYALNLLAIPGLAFATSWPIVALLVIVERTGKAIRGPARDVLLSEATAVVGHGSGFGIHAAMDQIGAVVGPLLMGFAIGTFAGVAHAYLILAIPAALALLSILLARSVWRGHAEPPSPKPPQELSRAYWFYVVASGILAAGFFDFPILALHLTKTGLLSDSTVAYLYAAAMGATGMTALICGRLFDRFGLPVLIVGILATMAALPLGFFGGQTAAVAAIILWGAGLGVQDATLRPLIAKIVSMHKRGTAFGAFNGVFGVMWFLGSALMGYLYDQNVIALVGFGLAAQVLAAVLFAVAGRWCQRGE